MNVAVAGQEVYVTDYSNHRIQVFSLTGTFIMWGSDGNGQGQFSNAYGVAVGGPYRLGLYMHVLTSALECKTPSPQLQQQQRLIGNP